MINSFYYNSSLKLIHLNDMHAWDTSEMESMRSIIKKELVVEIPNIDVKKDTCESCLRGKQTRQVFSQSTPFRATQVLQLIHRDLCGLITPPTAAQNKYIFVLIDDHSHYMWSILLKEKGEAFDNFKKFKALVEQEI